MTRWSRIIALILGGGVLVPWGSPAVAQQTAGPAEPEWWSDLVEFHVKVGGGTFSYREESSIVSGRFNGKVILGEARAGARLTEKTRFFLTATGAFTGVGTEESTRAVTSTGAVGASQQTNDLGISLLLFEPDFRHRVIDEPHLYLDVLVGWGMVSMSLTREKILIDGSAVSGTFEDSFFGHGPRAGAAARFTTAQLPRAFSVVLEATYTNFFGVNVTSDFLDGEAFTRGFGVKWDIGFRYQLRPAFGIELGYRGILLDFDRSDRVSGGIGTIRHGGQVPENTSRVDAFYLTVHWRVGG